MIRLSKRSMALALASMTLAGAAMGQAASPFGSFKHDAAQEIEIVADSLAVDQGTQKATFTGKVEAAQGSLRLTADKVVVNYGGVGAPDGAAPAGAGRIDKLRADGNVFLSNGAETASGAFADYDVSGGTVSMGGGVVLTQGDNAISGETLSIDLNSGKGEISGGRVRSVFKPAAQSE
jgi:lipopolysaccharide export system protein LptA